MHSTLWELGRLGIMEQLFQQWGLRHELVTAYSYSQLRYKDDKVKLFSAVKDGESDQQQQLAAWEVQLRQWKTKSKGVVQSVNRYQEKVLAFLG